MESKRDIIRQLIHQMDLPRLQALITLLKSLNNELLVSEDDRALSSYGNQARRMALELTDKIAPYHLDALVVLLKDPMDGLIVSENDWAIAGYRKQQYEQGHSKMVPAPDAIETMKNNLRKGK
jgi:hypothetical protein